MTENGAIHSGYQPSDASLSLRARIAQTIAPLRRVTPRAPFWKLGAHRIPVLWSLYRGLLRASLTPDIRWKVTQHFRKNQHRTSLEASKTHLRRAQKWLEVFQKAKLGDAHWKAVLERYSRLVVVRREKNHFTAILLKELAERKKLDNRPIMTAAVLRPSLFNPPLPRLKPQPVHITAMIRNRIRLRAKRHDRYLANNKRRREIKAEALFELTLARQSDTDFDKSFAEDPHAWLEPVLADQASIIATYARDFERRNKPFPPELLAQVAAARRNKAENKKREAERERRGEVIRRTILRANKTPPPHIIARMTPLQRHYDAVSRSNVSEVGYVGWVKRKLGWKLRDPNAWKVELGKDEDQPRLDEEERNIRELNERRRIREAKGIEQVTELS